MFKRFWAELWLFVDALVNGSVSLLSLNNHMRINHETGQCAKQNVIGDLFDQTSGSSNPESCIR